VSRLVQRAPSDRPASTDVADTASAGPKADIHARIIQVSVVAGKTRITIASGPDQGVEVGMRGAITDSSGAPLEGFTIEDAEGRVSHATVHLSPEEVEKLSEVVIGPSAAHLDDRRATSDVHARVLANSIVGGRTRITIGSGQQQGIQAGMTGALLGPGDREIADFTIESADHRMSYAFVEATLDQVHEATGVVIKASAGSAMDDKQF